MPSVRIPFVLLSVGCLLGAEKPAPRVAPFYSTESIVNAADNQSGALAPNSIGTVYGTNLAYTTAAINQNEIQGGVLPVMLGTCETQVFIDHLPADLYYVSPTQINFLVPPNLLPGPAVVAVFIDGIYGPQISMTLGAAAPGLFQLDAQNAIATLPDGTVLTPASPAKAGDTVVLWATGLGATNPQPVYGQLPLSVAPLVDGANPSILLNGTPLPPSAIYYAGQAPGFAGLYQINVTLPSCTPANPEIRVQVAGVLSVSKVDLPVLESTCP
jgi:uncharacterized protein (TIGR03437 family)